MTRSTRFPGGVKKKARKPRGWKQGHRGPSYDWCPYCFRPYCDPNGLSPHIAAKVDARFDAGVCPACGNHPCTCRSTSRSQVEQDWLDEKLAANREKASRDESDAPPED